MGIIVEAEQVLGNNFIRYSTQKKRGRPELYEVSSRGTMLDEPQVLRKLPPVGERIFLKETILPEYDSFCRDKTKIYERYFLNAFDIPREYKVIAYTEGIKRPLSKTNKLILEYRLGNLNHYQVDEMQVLACLVTCGFLNWERVEDYYKQMEKYKK